jgi:formylglycine-generating enzyme required for sulfatase activity
MFTAGSVGGIHDLTGNVWEWNADWFAGYTTSGMGCWIGASTTNAVCNNRATGLRVIRGGSWGANVAEDFRSASRGSNSPANRYDNVGFRCARDTP